jgi:hypothetical protein
VSLRSIKVDLDLAISKSTIHRIICKEPKLATRKLLRKPFLQKRHRGSRVDFARANMTTNWDTVLFSDEKRWCLDGPDGYKSYWHDLRKEELCLWKRQAGGGGIMVWGAVTPHFRSELVFISTKINAAKYQNILAEYVIPYLPMFDIFQQDNASPHSANSTSAFMNDHDLPVLDWPARSPDLSPIECVWGMLTRKVYADGKQYFSLSALKEAVSREWNSLTVNDIAPFFSAMPDKIFRVIRGRGAPL